MACCKAEEYGNWCADLETVEYEGQEYCIFHAPAECLEKQDVEAFNEKVFEWIDEAKEAGKGCDLSGTVFPGDISFSQYNKDNPLPEIWFNGAAFSGKVYFIRVVFNGGMRFRNASFAGEVYFIESIFKGTADFAQVIFSSNAYFTDAAFTETAFFSGSKFKKETYFTDGTFGQLSYFIRASFGDFADFNKAIFQGDAIFGRAAFAGYAYFNEAIFKQRARFFFTKFQLEGFFDATRLGQAYFRHCQFNNPTFFKNTTFESIDFIGCFASYHLQFDRINLNRASLLAAPIENCRFIDCTWPMSKGRRVVYDARLVNGKGYYPLDNIGEPEVWKVEEKPPAPGTLADIFRRLKKIATTEQDHALASDWHFNEKDMVRRDHWLKAKTNRHPFKSFFQNLFSGISLEIYRASSGYGERPLRAIFLLLAFVAAPIISSSDPGGFIPLVPAKFSTTTEFWPQFAKGLWRLLITVQAGMFALAVRNRMRR